MTMVGVIITVVKVVMGAVTVRISNMNPYSLTWRVTCSNIAAAPSMVPVRGMMEMMRMMGWWERGE